MKQKEIYKNIEEIKKYIMEEQKFELPKSLSDKRPYTFLKENFDDISNLEK